MNRQGAEDVQGSETILCDIVMMDTAQHTSVQTHRVHNTKSEC